MGWLPVLTYRCGAMFFHTHAEGMLGVGNSAVSLNRSGAVLHLQGELVHVGEDSVWRGGGRRAHSTV